MTQRIRTHDLIFLVTTLVKRDIKERYVGSFLGVFWLVILPLVQIIVFYVVFNGIMKARLGGGGEPGSYTLYLTSAIFSWHYFSEAVLRAPTLIRGHANLIKKISFPSEVLPVVAVLSSMVGLLIAYALFVFYMLVWTNKSGAYLLLLPVPIALNLVYGLGVSFLLAAIGTFVRDLSNITNIVFLFLFWFTPYVYTPDIFPAKFSWVLTYNPLAHLADFYRAIILHNTLPPLQSMAYTAAMGITSLIAGYFIFAKYRGDFGDVL
ncbi:MAG TPA: ABC transporter permease [Thermodesulfobacteriota bacterium]|nr:ABC transporter permease [Thermodesulfobacteriota bacterium]